jgi:hypothetical protein
MVLAQDYLLSAICPARIPTRNTSCNDVGGATRSVAGGGGYLSFHSSLRRE